MQLYIEYIKYTYISFFQLGSNFGILELPPIVFVSSTRLSRAELPIREGLPWMECSRLLFHHRPSHWLEGCPRKSVPLAPPLRLSLKELTVGHWWPTTLLTPSIPTGSKLMNSSRNRHRKPRKYKTKQNSQHVSFLPLVFRDLHFLVLLEASFLLPEKQYRSFATFAKHPHPGWLALSHPSPPPP